MKREEEEEEEKKEEEEEKEEEVVSVDEQDACVTDSQHYDLRSVLVRQQDRGLHLVVRHAQCSCCAQAVLNLQHNTFIQLLYTCFGVCLILTLIRLTYEFFTSSHDLQFGRDTVFNLAWNANFAWMLLFAIWVAVYAFKGEVEVKSTRKDVIPTVSATVQQV